MKIQKPTLGRIVEYATEDGFKHVGVVVQARSTPEYLGVVTFVTFGVSASDRVISNAFYNVPHDASGAPGTWCYPPRCTDEIEVER